VLSAAVCEACADEFEGLDDLGADDGALLVAE
jgi:hypothetical protein